MGPPRDSLMARLADNAPVESNVAHVRGGTVLPLSELAARSEDERAENFAFTDDDKDLLKDVLSGSNGHTP